MSALSNLTTYKPHRSQTDPKIRRLLESHYHYLKTHEKTQVANVDHEKAAPFYYNFFAFLNAMRIPRELHYIILLLSDIANPTHFDKTTTVIFIPDMIVLETIIAESGP